MPSWLTRGLVMAVLHAAGFVVLTKLLNEGADRIVLTSVIIALLVGVALMWGSVDGWLRRDTPVVTWVIAGVAAGPLGGLLNVIGRGLLVDETGVADLWPQLSVGAAFTALLIMVPAGVGVLVGSRLEPPTAVDGEPAAAEPKAPSPKPRPAPSGPRRTAEAAARRRARHRAATSARQPRVPPRS